MLRTILIADDESMNREILRNMLGKDYSILTAESGARALAILREQSTLISAVLLDLKMPDMDGYEVLKALRANEQFQAIPVIVATSMNDIESEEKAVSLGAYGFVTKPYRSVLIKRHLNNAIAFRETSALQNLIRRDDLTKILNLRGFTEQAEAMIRSKPLGYYILSCFDIDSFKVINDQYGTDKGDQVLKHVADTISDCVTPLGGICCRISSDDFATLYPVSYLGSPALKEGLMLMTNPTCISRTITVRIGRYLVDEGSISVSAMYDRAMLAKDSIRGKYDVFEANYDNAMRRQLLMEQEIVSEMGAALAEHQFEVWYQPQFNHASGAMIGAEALVRWRHPVKGMIAPGEFVPVFERNGFIYALDRYIWEEVCVNLRKWIDLGRNPLPVSVNISREDISKADIVETLVQLVESYGLDVSLLRLEITETAFAESSDIVASVAKQLIARGFTVEIDDFGSGYSSLNTLKDVPAQIIKLDMKFLDTADDSQRGGNIIESVVRMAKWLGMSVIAEGVETLEQANYLRSIGCYYMQGYLYAKPMPRDKYEVFCSGNSKEEHLLALETVDNLDNNSFWDPKSMDTLIFNSYVGAACIYEYHSGRIELLRATEKYAQVVGSAGMTVEDALKLDWTEHLDEKTLSRVVRDLERSIAEKSEVTGEYVFLDLPGCPHETYLRSTMRVIASAGERYLVYCTNENVTAQRQAERELLEANRELRTLMDDTPGGFARMRMRADGSGHMEYANDGFCRILGMTRAETLAAYSGNVMSRIHPDDFDEVSAQVTQAFCDDGLLTMKHRLRAKNGDYVWVQVFTRFTKTEDGEAVVNCYYADLSELEKRKLSLQETMPLILSAIMGNSENLDFAKDKDFNYICCSPAFVKFTRQKSEAEVIGHSDYDFWSKEEADRFRSDDVRLFEGGESLINFTEPIPSDDGIQHYSVTSKYILRDSAGEIIGLYGSGRDVTDTRAALDRLQLLTDSIPGGLATYSVGPEGIKISYFNDGFCRLFDCSREEYTRMVQEHGVLSLVFPEDVPGIMAQLEALKAEGRPIDCTYRSRFLDSKGFRWLNFRGVPAERYEDTVTINAVLYDVTTQHEAERELREAAAQIRNMMDDMPGGFVRLRLWPDGSREPVYINSGFATLLGYSREELMSRVSGDLMLSVHPEDAEAVKAAHSSVAEMLKDGENRRTRYRLRRSDGSYIWLSVLGRVTKNAFDEAFLNVYYSDLSEQVKSEETQKALLDNLPGGAGIYEFKDGRLSLTYQNKSYWDLVGLDRENPDNAPMSAVHPDDVQVIMNELASAIAQGRDMDCEIRMRHPSRGYRQVHLLGRIVRKAAERFLIYATFSPVDSGGLTYQQTLPLLLSAIMEASNDFTFAKDRDFRYLCCSPAFLRLAGLDTEAQAVGKTDFELFPEDMAKQFRENDLQLMKAGKPLVDFDETIHAPDGSIHYCLASKHILRDGAGAAIGIYGVSRDITREKNALEQLQLVNDSLPGGVATYSFREGELRVAYCNDGFCRLFGGSRDGMEKRGDFDPMDWVLEEDRAQLMSHILALVEKNAPMDELFRIRAIDGSIKWINEKAIATERRGDTVLFNAILLDVTQRQDYNERLRISEEENTLAVQHGGIVVCRFDVAARSLTLSPSAAASYNMPEKIFDLPYEMVRSGLVSPESSDAFIGFFESIMNGSRAENVVYQQRNKDKWLWMEARGTTIFSDDGKPVKAVISLFDVTESLEKETIYKKWQHSLEDRAPESYTLFRCDLNKNSSYDTKEGTLFTYDVDDAGYTFNDRSRSYAMHRVSTEDRDRYLAFLNSDTMLASYYRGKRSDVLEYRELTEDGVRWIRLTVDLVESPSSTDVDAYLMYEDIDEIKRLQLQTKELSETDPLTGILNRKTFAAKAEQLIHGARPGAKHALLMLDLDGFKQVNDVFGHGAGDKALIDTALALRSIMRRDDLVARLGGDEFVVFLSNITDKQDAASKAKQICALAKKSFSLEVEISGSVGVALCPGDGEDFNTLYKKADAALYYVKGSGKDNYVFYNDGMENEHLTPEADVILGSGKKAEKKRRMLIVDDSLIDHAMLQNIFCDDFIVEKAQDGGSALVRLRHYGSAISVVLLDLMMPGMDGFAVLKKMQESPELRSIPVIIVSGDESRETCLKAIRQGATDFITKPVDAELLRIRVHSAVSKAENQRLRAKNSLLEVMNEERLRYDSALEGAGISFVELDWRTGEFSYDPSISHYLLGVYDKRPLWQILLSDMVADTRTVQLLQQLVHRIAEDKSRRIVSTQAQLKTPERVLHNFRVTVRRLANEHDHTSKLIISLDDLDYEVQDERRHTVTSDN